MQNEADQRPQPHQQNQGTRNAGGNREKPAGWARTLTFLAAILLMMAAVFFLTLWAMGVPFSTGPSAVQAGSSTLQKLQISFGIAQLSLDAITLVLVGTLIFVIYLFLITRGIIRGAGLQRYIIDPMQRAAELARLQEQGRPGQDET